MSPKDEKELRSGERVLFAFAGAVVVCFGTLIFAFTLYGIPSTTSGVDGVLRVLPIAALCGCVGGLLIAYFVQRKGRQ
jgi:hypothetical protein